MHAHSLSLSLPMEFNDLIDEEFDALEGKRPFNRKTVRECSGMLCEGRTWDDPFDGSDSLCELQM